MGCESKGLEMPFLFVFSIVGRAKVRRKSITA